MTFSYGRAAPLLSPLWSLIGMEWRERERERGKRKRDENSLSPG